jgi:hypothetical protein
MSSTRSEATEDYMDVTSREKFLTTRLTKSSLDLAPHGAFDLAVPGP